MSYYSFGTLSEIIATTLFAAGLAYVGKFHRPVLWSPAILKPVVAVASLVSATTGAYYLIITLKPPYEAQVRPLLHIAKDAAGASGVCLLTLVAVQILVVIEARRVRGIAQLFEVAPIVFCAAVVAASVVALMNPAPDTNLDLSTSGWAVAYRLVIGFPSILYANLTAFFFLEGYLRRRRSSTPQENTLLKRYLFIAGSAASLGSIAVLQAAWPATYASHTSGILQSALYVSFTVCGLAGLLLRFKPSDIDRSIESFEEYHEIFGQYLAFEVHGLSTEPNHLPPHVPSAAAQKELVRTAAKLLRSTPDGPVITEDHVDLTQKTLSVAAKIAYDREGGDQDYLERLRVFTSLRSQYSDLIPDHAPQKSLATHPSTVDLAVHAATMLTESHEECNLKDAPPCTQLAAGFAAVFGRILTPKQERQILDETVSCLNPNILWAIVWTTYSLEKTPAYNSATPRTKRSGRVH